jgi:hypothetical protein
VVCIITGPGGTFAGTQIEKLPLRPGNDWVDVATVLPFAITATDKLKGGVPVNTASKVGHAPAQILPLLILKLTVGFGVALTTTSSVSEPHPGVVTVTV